jgi:RHS repeat-associated protein
MNENWRLKQETIWLDDIPIAVLKKTVNTDSIQVYFIHADHLNTPRVIVDVSNTPVWRWENRQAFGDNFPDEDPDRDGTLFKYNLRFAGQYFDNETRLHYNYFRNYDPETGRYISSDPIGLAGGLNTYGYVRGSPLLYIDPLGLFDMNASLGTGGSFHYGVVGLGGTTNLAIDTNGQICIVTQICSTFGVGIFANLGISGSIGTGSQCEGASQTGGIFVEGGTGITGSGSITTDGKGGNSLLKGVIGIGAGGAGGFINCFSRAFCFN